MVVCNNNNNKFYVVCMDMQWKHIKYQGFRFPYLFTQTNMIENNTSTHESGSTVTHTLTSHWNIDSSKHSDLKLMPSNVGNK